MRIPSRLLGEMPFLPYLAFGLVLAWGQLSNNGYQALPSLLSNPVAFSYANPSSSLCNGVVLLAAGATAASLGDWFLKPQTCRICGIVSSLAGTTLLAISLLFPKSMATGIATCCLYAVNGAATAVIFLNIGNLYGKLSGRDAVVNLAWSHVFAGSFYFITVGMSFWTLFTTRDTFIGALAFVLMPLAAALLAGCTPNENQLSEDMLDSDSSKLPKVFWKLVIVILVLCFAMAFFSSASSGSSSLAVLSGKTAVNNFLRIIIAFALMTSIVLLEGKSVRLGRIYTVIMVSSIVVVAMAPVMDSAFEWWGQLSGVVLLIFRMLHWTVLSLIVCQKHLSAVLVFGFGAGAQAVGQATGSLAGSLVKPIMMDSSAALIASIAFTLVIVVCAFLLFSERSLDELFTPSSDDEMDLDELFAPAPQISNEKQEESTTAQSKDTAEHASKPSFNAVVANLSIKYGLSKRESEIFRLIAMGYSAQVISGKLCISWNTVRGHSRNVYAKMGIHSRQELIAMVDEARSCTLESKL